MNKFKGLSLIVLGSLSLGLCSCSAESVTIKTGLEKVKEICSGMQANPNTKFSCEYEGHFLNLWNSNSSEIVYGGAFEDNGVFESCLLEVTVFNDFSNSDNVESMYRNASSLLYASNFDYEIAPYPTKNEYGGLTLSMRNYDTCLYLSGIYNNRIYEGNYVSSYARWNVDIVFDSQGCLIEEHAWVTQSYTSATRGTIDIKATYEFN